MTLRDTLREDLRAWSYHTGTRLRWWQMAMLPLNPPLTALGLYRISQWLHSHRYRAVARAVYALNTYLTGCEIRPECDIGPGLFMPHPTGVILAPAKVGRNAVLAPRVGIGARGTRADDGMPTIGDNVTIYLNSSILGPITIGDDAIISGHSMVVTDIPPGVIARGIPARVLRKLTEDEIRARRRPAGASPEPFR